MSDKPLHVVSRAKALELWEYDPLAVLAFFRDCATTLIQVVAGIHADAKGASNPAEPLSALAEEWHGLLHPNLESARSIWIATSAKECLTRPEPVRVDRHNANPCRFDGCCFHEVAINFADGVISCADGGMANRDFASMLRQYTARGNHVTDYLLSLVADIRCECRDGMSRWRASEELSNKGRKGAEIDPLIASAARQQASENEEHKAAREVYKARRFTEDASTNSWARVLGFTWIGTRLSEMSSTEWARLIGQAVSASTRAGKIMQLERLSAWSDDSQIKRGCRLAGRLIGMVLRGDSESSIARNLREIINFGELRDGLEVVAENLRTGGPHEKPLSIAPSESPPAAAAEAVRQPDRVNATTREKPGARAFPVTNCGLRGIEELAPIPKMYLVKSETNGICFRIRSAPHILHLIRRSAKEKPATIQ